MLRKALKNDLNAIWAIKNHYITRTNALWASEALSKAEIQAWWEEHGSARAPVVVIEREGEILGYASLSRYRTWPGYRFAAELSIYVAPKHLGEGWGVELMRGILAAAREGDLRTIVSYIDAENEASVRFHKRFGFSLVGTIQDVGEKWGLRRSVTIMQLNL